jgi:hypothetical protein
MISGRIKDFSSAHFACFGKPVILLIVIRRCHAPSPCSIVGEAVADVRVRINPGWEMHPRRESILADEEEGIVPEPRVN